MPDLSLSHAAPSTPQNFESAIDQACDAEPSCALAIGVGFRKACPPEILTALVQDAWTRMTSLHPSMVQRPAALVTIAEKDRPVLRQTGAAMGLRVVILSKQALTGTDDRITVTSSKAKACLGIPSIAEAAALAAAGPGSRLLLARISVPDATCAIAVAAGGGTL